jgi:hypothetical protein
MNTIPALLNGINVLRNLFLDGDSFVEHAVQHILLFNKTSNDHFCHKQNMTKVPPSFGNKQETVRFTKENPLYHEETGGKNINKL